jgi:REP element-mobilizing transposase RayT
MPRKARIDASGAVHHIIIRGIERKKIFRNDSDRENFIERLGKIVTETKTACFGWCLIPNHAHLLLRTGLVSISTVMRRLLTGYAVSFNNKYRRHGPLFQNRYKSILCQEDLYLKELARYIHLNPLRAGLVSDMKALDGYGWCGHSAIMGKVSRGWQNTEYILRYFDDRKAAARKRYRRFIQEGVSQGKRSDLTGGGLIRSLGGWQRAKAMRRAGIRIKGDERMLGDGEFVEQVLKATDEQLEQRYALKAKGYDFETVVSRVAEIMDIEPAAILSRSRSPQTVKARRLLCYWASRELGMTTVELSKRLRISQPTASRAAQRGERIVMENDFRL